METFCNDLKERATNIINYEKKKMIPLTDEENSPIKRKKYVIYAKKTFSTDDDKRSIIKSEIIVTTQENIDEWVIVFLIENIEHQKKFL